MVVGRVCAYHWLKQQRFSALEESAYLIADAGTLPVRWIIGAVPI